MMGVINTAWATIIACGVNSMPRAAQRARARQQQKHHQAHHDRRQTHEGVEKHDHPVAAGKPCQGDERARAACQ